MQENIMTFLINLVNKSFMALFFISCLYTLRHMILFFIDVKNGQKYMATNKELFWLGGAIAIIFTIIFSGIKLI